MLAVVLAFVFLVGLAVLANKIVCGWACPLPTAKNLVDGKFFAADCYSCARCLNVCPEEAIAHRSVLSKTGKGEEKPAE